MRDVRIKLSYLLKNSYTARMDPRWRAISLKSHTHVSLASVIHIYYVLVKFYESYVSRAYATYTVNGKPTAELFTPRSTSFI